MINYQKDFYLHIILSLENNGLYKAKSIFGNNAIVYDYCDVNEIGALNGLNGMLNRSMVYNSLIKDPSSSLWPHSNSQQVTSTNVLDLHIECGSVVDSTNGSVRCTYAYTELTILSTLAPYQVVGIRGDHFDAIDSMIQLLDMMKTSSQFPTYSTFPFSGLPSPQVGLPIGGTSPTPVASPTVTPGYPRSVSPAPPAARPPVPAEAKKKELKRRLPSDIIDIVHPACQDVCTSWDIFGKIKCKNMCEWRNV